MPHRQHLRSFSYHLHVFACGRVSGEPIPTKPSSLKRPARQRSNPFPEEARRVLPDRKMGISALEWCQMSDYQRCAERMGRTMLLPLLQPFLLSFNLIKVISEAQSACVWFKFDAPVIAAPCGQHQWEKGFCRSLPFLHM